MNNIVIAVAIAGLVSNSQMAAAAQGEMGAGVPNFGIYSSAVSSEVRVWTLSNPTMPFPSGCTSINLTPATMGMDYFKMAVGILSAANLSNRTIRFYAHAPRDGGCGVDYIELAK